MKDGAVGAPLSTCGKTGEQCIKSFSRGTPREDLRADGWIILNSLSLSLPLAPQPSLDLGLPLFFSEASQQFSFLQGRVVSPTPNPQSGEPGLCIYIPQGAGWPSYTPRHRVPILVTSYDMHGLRWDYSYSPVTTRGIMLIWKGYKFVDWIRLRIEFIGMLL
jgi:hypothetical protein